MVKKARSDFMKLMAVILAAWVGVTILGVVFDLEIPGLLFTLSWVIPPIWVARDARRRGVENPLLWVVFVLLTWFVGLVVYLILRPQEPLVMECDGCGKEFERVVFGSETDAVDCPECGSKETKKQLSVFSCSGLSKESGSACSSPSSGFS